MKIKKAQGAMNAAVLVAIVAALIILYIIFLPASDREALINGDGNSSESGNFLLRVSPGLLGTSKGLENQKSLPNILLVETSTAKELYAINQFTVKKSLFDEKTKTEAFDLENPQSTDNVVLSFSAKKRQGTLLIELNDELIFESELSSEVVEPIRIPKSKLKVANTLKFSVSSPGLAFWKSNEYLLENVRIIGDISDASRQESNNLFIITETEKASMERGTLKFIPYCGDVNDLGPLEVQINQRRLFSTVPICDEQYKQAIPQSMLNEGENTIVFRTTKGSYSIEQIEVALDFKSPRLRTYYFELSEQQFKNIRSGSNDIELRLKFVDDKRIKRIKLDVNGHLETVDTDKLVFAKNINSKVSQGNNFVRLEPFDEIEVLELVVAIK